MNFVLHLPEEEMKFVFACFCFFCFWGGGGGVGNSNYGSTVRQIVKIPNEFMSV